jgi:hypothetical protein
MRRLRRYLTYANVASTLALLIAIAGGTTAIAAKMTAPKNSVTSKSIRNGNVTAKDLTTAVIANASGSVTDPAPADGTFTPASAQVNCPAGARPIGGGVSGGGINRVFVATSVMSRTGWTGAVLSDASGTQQFTVTAWCLIRKPGQPASQ